MRFHFMHWQHTPSHFLWSLMWVPLPTRFWATNFISNFNFTVMLLAILYSFASGPLRRNVLEGPSSFRNSLSKPVYMPGDASVGAIEMGWEPIPRALHGSRSAVRQEAGPYCEGQEQSVVCVPAATAKISNQLRLLFWYRSDLLVPSCHSWVLRQSWDSVP